MSSAAEKVLVPDPTRRSAPLSEADATAWRTLAVFCVYRVVLALFIAMAFAFLNRFFNIGVVAPAAVMPTLTTYALMSLVLLALARVREPGIALQVTAGIGVDVIGIVVLMYASGGVKSGPVLYSLSIWRASAFSSGVKSIRSASETPCRS